MLQKSIPVIASQYRKHTTFYKGANLANCIKIKPDCVKKNSSKFLKVGCSQEFVPNLLLTNVMSLVPKMDELEHVTKQNNAVLVFISETWLKSSVPDELIEINGYRVFRRDRIGKEHGGVCIYSANHDISYV
jgi:hypothetical protein